MAQWMNSPAAAVAGHAFPPPPQVGEDLRSCLSERYAGVRAFSARLCEPLVTEDFVIQSMPEASPTRWHLAHTSWFFETFVLARALPAYRPFHPAFERLFNSYYQSVGEPFPRARRGLLSRPTVWEVFEYRRHVDAAMKTLLADPRFGGSDLADVVELGLHHEQQHQELMLTDIKHVFSCNPLGPAYRLRKSGLAAGNRGAMRGRMGWTGFEEAVRCIGHSGGTFCFDNERPRHRVFLEAFEIADRLVTNGEYLEFIADGGYERPEFWLADGWDTAVAQKWLAPLYWERRGDEWWTFTLAGPLPLEVDEPVCHVSFYEADAFARWAGARLPTEAEWETAAAEVTDHAGLAEANFAETELFHPRPSAGASPGVQQMFGDVWEWTASPYTAYPGYRAAEGALGEYNGKFMSNQMVLRGGSCATPRSHIRPTYRNFFAPDARWQFTGIRLAR